MQMLYAAFLALSIIGIPAVSAQGTRTVYFTSAAAPPDTKCLNVPGTQGKRIPVQMLVHSCCLTVNDSQLMAFFYIETIAATCTRNDGRWDIHSSG